VPLEIALAVLLVLLCIGGIVLWARLAATSARTIDVPAGEPDRLFRGGVLCRHLITSGSLARLELHDWGVRLNGTVISRWIVPTWEARYEELAIAELAALPASRLAVWLRLRGEPGAIGFLSDRSQEILPLLAGHGVPVNRSVTRVRRVEELYQKSP
jgi:hypothetical protein